MHPVVKLAIRSVEHFIETGKLLPCPDPLPKDLNQNAGTFVSIKKKGELRGCIGTMVPKYKNLAEEIIQNAFRAANQDPRFIPIEKKELPELAFSVDLLTPLEKIENLKGQDIKKIWTCGKGKRKAGTSPAQSRYYKIRRSATQSLLKKRRV